MTTRVVARQYAHALFDVAQRSGQLDRVGRALADFGQIVVSHADLAKVFASAAVPIQQKKAVVQAVLQALGGVSVELERLLLLLADRDRLMLVGEIGAVFSERAMNADRVVRAEITSAVALDGNAQAALGRALGTAMGRQVTITERVDPALVGGLVAKVGSVVFDGSIARQIERLREKLLADV
jgi:F-type H+-transporting ATPase subunit delta